MPKSKTLDPTEQFQIKWGKAYISIRHNLAPSSLIGIWLMYLQIVRGIKSPLSPNVPQGLQFEEKVCVQVLPEIVSGERILVWSSW